ncbi:MAG: OmpA family protein [Deltaproteobacteria bacterium]|nr:OmpA family protein [Deltaproteobacteria bacterium]
MSTEHADPPQAGRVTTHADPPQAGRVTTHADLPQAGRVKAVATATRVWGEAAPLWLTLALGASGALAAAGAAWLVVPSLEAPVDPPVSLSNAVIPAATVMAPSPVANAATTAPSVASSARTTPCPPIVIGFAFASAGFDATESAAVDELGDWLAPQTEATVLLHGHADAYGKDESNLALSRMRAVAVANRLASRGVARSRITARGFGAFQPVEGVPEEAASNRRVVVYVKGTSGCKGQPR